MKLESDVELLFRCIPESAVCSSVTRVRSRSLRSANFRAFNSQAQAAALGIGSRSFSDVLKQLINSIQTHMMSAQSPERATPGPSNMSVKVKSPNGGKKRARKGVVSDEEEGDKKRRNRLALSCSESLLPPLKHHFH